jgi:DNA-binding transcriptional LysR family regulator
MSRINSRAEMEAFVRSAELGGFSAAARELGLTPSALSRFVKRLEQRLGVQLLHRTTRNLVVTPEGGQLLRRMRAIIDDMEAAESEIAGSDTPRGRLQMTAGVGFGMRQFLPLLPRFRERYPQVQVDLRIEDRVADLVREGIDLSVSLLMREDPSLAVRKLCDVDRVICASPAYLARRGVPRTPEDLQLHSCITLQGVPASTAWPFTGGQRIQVRGDVTVNNAQALLELALAGSGIIRMNEMVVGDALRQGTLIPILRSHYDGERSALCASYPEGRDRVPRVAAMLDFLEEHFAHPPWRAGKPARPGKPAKAAKAVTPARRGKR